MTFELMAPPSRARDEARFWRPDQVQACARWVGRGAKEAMAAFQRSAWIVDALALYSACEQMRTQPGRVRSGAHLASDEVRIHFEEQKSPLATERRLVDLVSTLASQTGA